MDDEVRGSGSGQIVKKSVRLMGKILFFFEIVTYIESVDLKKTLAVLCISPRARKVFKIYFFMDLLHYTDSCLVSHISLNKACRLFSEF